MPGGTIRQLCEELVPEAFVERARLEAERLQIDAPASLRPRLVPGDPQKPFSVSPAADRFRYPEEREVESASPNVPERPAEHRAAIVSEEEWRKAMLSLRTCTLWRQHRASPRGLSVRGIAVSSREVAPTGPTCLRRPRVSVAQGSGARSGRALGDPLRSHARQDGCTHCRARSTKVDTPRPIRRAGRVDLRRRAG